MAANPMGKSRPVSNPYLTIVHAASGWSWKVLKAYSADPDKPYARWFLATSSPYAKDELGDGYIGEVNGRITQIDPIVPAEAIPEHLRTQVTLIHGETRIRGHF